MSEAVGGRFAEYARVPANRPSPSFDPPPQAMSAQIQAAHPHICPSGEGCLDAPCPNPEVCFPATESDAACPAVVRCADQALCPSACRSAGNREGNHKKCYWCGETATGTAMDGLYENGRQVSRMGGRFASCGDHGFGWLMWSDPSQRVIPPASTPTGARP